MLYDSTLKATASRGSKPMKTRIIPSPCEALQARGLYCRTLGPLRRG
jgi:hypothetical protein